MELGRLTAVFDADTRKFDAGMRGVESKVGGVTNVMKSLGSASVALQGPLGGVAGRLQGISALASQASSSAGLLGVGIAALSAATIGLGVALFNLAQNAAEAAGDLFDLSQKTGFAVETLSTLSNVAKTTGGDIDSISASLGIFQRNMVEAQDATSAQGKLFKSLSLDTRDNEKALRQAFVTLGHMSEGANQTALAMKLFGRSGKDVLAIVKETNGNLDLAQQKFADLGTLISGPVAQQADKFNDDLEQIKMQLSAMARTVGAETLPAFIALFGETSAALEANKSEWKEWGHVAAMTILTVQTLLGGVMNVLRNADWKNAIPLYGPYKVLRDFGSGMNTTAERVTGAYSDIVNPPVGVGASIGSMGRSGAGFGGGGGGGSKKGRGAKADKDEMAAYKQILDSVSRSLDFFGEKTEHARVEQEFLRAGIEKLSPELKAQADLYRRTALVLADTIDVKKKTADNDAKLKEAEEQLAKVTEDVNEAVFKQEQAISDLMTGMPGWVRDTLDFIEAKQKEGYAWSVATAQIYLNNEALKEQLRVQGEGATRLRRVFGVSTGNETRPRFATSERADQKLAEVRAQMMELGQELTGIFSHSIADGFDQGAKHGLVTLAQGLLQIVEDVFLKKLAEGLGNILGDFMGGSSGAGGSIWSKLLGIGIGSLGGGIKGAGAGGMPVPFLGGVFADGGYLKPGQWGIAGENGPERIYGGQTGMTVIPNAGKQTVVHNHYSINLPPTPRGGYTSPKSQRQQAETLMTMLRGAQV